jgi:peptidoglycan/LPS O-acetylase OafA/YrhL
VNGSLYTLPFELRLYVAVALMGVTGLLTRRRAALAVMAVATAVALARPEWIDRLFDAGRDQHVAQLALLFALGMLAYLWRERIPVSRAVGLALLVLVAIDPGGLVRETLFAPVLAYLVLVFAYHPRLRWRAYQRAGDYSYGLYVYAFPIQQTLIERIPGIAPAALFALALPLTLALAVVSWHALERPLLGLKSLSPRPAPTP